MKMFEDLFEMLVPAEGKADTVLGENIRALAFVGYKYFNDGEEYYNGEGIEYDNKEEEAAFGGREKTSLRNAVDYLMSKNNPLYKILNNPYDYYNYSRFAGIRQTQVQLRLKKPLSYDYELEKDEYGRYMRKFDDMASRLVILYNLKDGIQQVLKSKNPLTFKLMDRKKDYNIIHRLDDHIRWCSILNDYDKTEGLWEDGVKNFFDKNEIDCKEFEE